MKKPRSDSKLKSLPKKARAQLWEFLQTHSLIAAIPFVKEKFGRSTTRTALSEFYSWYPLSRELEDFEQLTGDVRDLMASNPNLDLDSENLSRTGQAIFETRAIKDRDPELFVELRKLRQKDRDQAATERRLKLLEANARKAASTLRDSRLNDSQKAERLREIFKK